MTPRIVLDASALLAVALHEPGGDIVLSYITKPRTGIFIHSINAFEVVTKLLFRGFSGESAWGVIDNPRISLVEDTDAEILAIASRIKYATPSLSLGDCFCIALTEYMAATCLTSDKQFRDADTKAEISQFRA